MPGMKRKCGGSVMNGGEGGNVMNGFSGGNDGGKEPVNVPGGTVAPDEVPEQTPVGEFTGE